MAAAAHSPGRFNAGWRSRSHEDDAFGLTQQAHAAEHETTSASFAVPPLVAELARSLLHSFSRDVPLSDCYDGPPPTRESTHYADAPALSVEHRASSFHAARADCACIACTVVTAATDLHDDSWPAVREDLISVASAGGPVHPLSPLRSPIGRTNNTAIDGGPPRSRLPTPIKTAGSPASIKKPASNARGTVTGEVEQRPRVTSSSVLSYKALIAGVRDLALGLQHVFEVEAAMEVAAGIESSSIRELQLWTPAIDAPETDAAAHATFRSNQESIDGHTWRRLTPSDAADALQRQPVVLLHAQSHTALDAKELQLSLATWMSGAVLAPISSSVMYTRGETGARSSGKDYATLYARLRPQVIAFHSTTTEAADIRDSIAAAQHMLEASKAMGASVAPWRPMMLDMAQIVVRSESGTGPAAGLVSPDAASRSPSASFFAVSSRQLMSPTRLPGSGILLVSPRGAQTLGPSSPAGVERLRSRHLQETACSARKKVVSSQSSVDLGSSFSPVALLSPSTALGTAQRMVYPLSPPVGTNTLGSPHLRRAESNGSLLRPRAGDSWMEVTFFQLMRLQSHVSSLPAGSRAGARASSAVSGVSFRCALNERQTPAVVTAADVSRRACAHRDRLAVIATTCIVESAGPIQWTLRMFTHAALTAACTAIQQLQGPAHGPLSPQGVARRAATRAGFGPAVPHDASRTAASGGPPPSNHDFPPVLPRDVVVVEPLSASRGVTQAREFTWLSALLFGFLPALEAGACVVVPVVCEDASSPQPADTRKPAHVAAMAIKTCVGSVVHATPAARLHMRLSTTSTLSALGGLFSFVAMREGIRTLTSRGATFPDQMKSMMCFEVPVLSPSLWRAAMALAADNAAKPQAPIATLPALEGAAFVSDLPLCLLHGPTDALGASHVWRVPSTRSVIAKAEHDWSPTAVDVCAALHTILEADDSNSSLPTNGAALVATALPGVHCGLDAMSPAFAVDLDAAAAREIHRVMQLAARAASTRVHADPPPLPAAKASSTSLSSAQLLVLTNPACMRALTTASNAAGTDGDDNGAKEGSAAMPAATRVMPDAEGPAAPSVAPVVLASAAAPFVLEVPWGPAAILYGTDNVQSTAPAPSASGEPAPGLGAAPARVVHPGTTAPGSSVADFRWSGMWDSTMGSLRTDLLGALVQLLRAPLLQHHDATRAADDIGLAGGPPGPGMACTA